jgi:hypothetical protein
VDDSVQEERDAKAVSNLQLGETIEVPWRGKGYRGLDAKSMPVPLPPGSVDAAWRATPENEPVVCRMDEQPDLGRNVLRCLLKPLIIALNCELSGRHGLGMVK